MEQLTIRLMEELRKNAILLRRCFLHPGPQVGQNSRLLTILLENPGQTGADGSFTDELTRTKSFSYSMFNLEACNAASGKKF